MRTAGWRHTFESRPWDESSSRMHEMSSMHPTFLHMATIVDSVIETGMTAALAACTSMHDLLVVPTPIQVPPYDLVAIRAPGSHRKPADGFVLIEHLSVTGHNDEIERPVEDAVPLFWRFMIEKFGIRPNWPTQAQAEPL